MEEYVEMERGREQVKWKEKKGKGKGKGERGWLKRNGKEERGKGIEEKKGLG